MGEGVMISPYLNRPLRTEEQARRDVERRRMEEELREAERRVCECIEVLNENDRRAHEGGNDPFYFTGKRLRIRQTLGAWVAKRDRLRKELGYE
jgi:hypothetical protein